MIVAIPVGQPIESADSLRKWLSGKVLEAPEGGVRT
jgi:hypothetical protein